MTTHLLHWTKSDEKIERVTFTADQGALVFTPRIDQPEMKLDVTGHLRAKMQMRALAEALLRYLEDTTKAQERDSSWRDLDFSGSDRALTP